MKDQGLHGEVELGMAMAECMKDWIDVLAMLNGDRCIRMLMC